ncbi:MAG: YfcE family phosphodiesterase [Candidatus Aenigmatarchaeota archaeon]|nr:MAG: YfcE family phosphodiesterase [Candidatus Aenigmarchaeota archaeon]
MGFKLPIPKNIMRLLVLADIHGQWQELDRIIDAVKDEDFDAVICPGDFTDMFSVPPEFTQMDVGNMVLQRLLTLKKPLFAVPGNHDPYELLDLLDDFDVNCHGKLKQLKGYQIAGWGGAVTPFHTKFEPTDEETQDALRLIEEQKRGKLIFLTHNPPYNTQMDRTISGQHVGSKLIRDFIERVQPVLVISAHIHEAFGQDTLNNTVIFNPGPVYEGRYGLVTLEPEIRCELKKI